MVILITGCTSGLGRTMCRLYSKIPGFKLVITGRGDLLDLKREFPDSDSLMVRKLDLVFPEDFGVIIDEVIRKWGRIDVLINNAAIVYRAVLEHVDDETERLQIQVNYLSPRALIRTVIPIMRSQKSGKIINISSVAGMMAMPTMSSYSASKHALGGMTESLWYELKPFNVSVSLIEIGFLNSNSFKKTILPKEASSPDLIEHYRLLYSTMDQFISRLMKTTVYTPEIVAKRILNKVILKDNPELRVAGTIDAYVFRFFRRILPSWLYHRILYATLPNLWKNQFDSFFDL